MKTIVFTMFLKGLDITNQLMFQSKIIKIHACNPNMLFDTPNHRKYQKVTKIVSNGGPKIHQKSLKIHSGTLQGPPGCICAQLDHQNGRQGPPNGPKMVSWGPKNT